MDKSAPPEGQFPRNLSCTKEYKRSLLPVAGDASVGNYHDGMVGGLGCVVVSVVIVVVLLLLL